MAIYPPDYYGGQNRRSLSDRIRSLMMQKAYRHHTGMGPHQIADMESRGGLEGAYPRGDVRGRPVGPRDWEHPHPFQLPADDPAGDVIGRPGSPFQQPGAQGPQDYAQATADAGQPEPRALGLNTGQHGFIQTLLGMVQSGQISQEEAVRRWRQFRFGG